MRLSELNTGDVCVVAKILGHGAFRKRVIEMGFVKGRPVRVLQHAPLRDPIKYAIMNYEVSLRAAEANMIEVVKVDDPAQIASLESAGTVEVHDVAESIVRDRHRIVNVALIGNPNCGKTSLYNELSGASEHVGNYSGVTVDAKLRVFHHKGYTFRIVDLPGTYSLTTYSPEELYVRRYLHDNTPDVIVNVVDSTNLERNLYLTTELIDMDRRMVVALNMFDELRRSGARFDYEMLGGMVGVPMVPIVARTGEGVEKLLDTVLEVYNDVQPNVRHIHVNLGADTEAALRRLVDALKGVPGIQRRFSPRYVAIKLLEGDREAENELAGCEGADGIIALRDELRAELSQLHGEDISAQVAGAKYGFIAGALAETMTAPPVDTREVTRRVDNVVTNKILGFPIFFAIMFFIFWATFVLGQYPMDWIESGVDGLSELLNRMMPDGVLKDLIADGIIGGVGGVIVFLPNILILYFCISFMEDSGYMARAAFIMDKVMHRVGLHGKSFIPLVMGFGCNVPAIMATRAIESHSSRLITILINPFMSCSARVPLYVLLVGTFFSAHAALVFSGLYVAGILVAVMTARLLRKLLFRKEETPFVMELPPYRIPTLRSSLLHTWAKGVEYLKKMGGIILVASIVVWALNYFPISSHDNPAQDSYLESIGKTVQPVMEPIGFSWRGSVAALAGVPAKEIVVSTLGVLYTDDEAVAPAKLGERLRSVNPHTGRPDFSGAEALSFMVFILLYCPCLATVMAIARETGSWRWAAFSIVYNTLLAWLVAFATYRVALLCW
ncbi:MAG: ferrous iron transport protein B [Muribaculaceae bacterium]|nr:ferrous iron transport protein B [Muribaculaceae bacterium]